MRIGLTQMNPNKEFSLPLYALPDLVSMGPSWLYAITKTLNNMSDDRRQDDINPPIRDPQELILDYEGGLSRPVFVPPLPVPLDANGAAGGGAEDNENMIHEALFHYRRFPKVIQSEL